METFYMYNIFLWFWFSDSTWRLKAFSPCIDTKALFNLGKFDQEVRKRYEYLKQSSGSVL